MKQARRSFSPQFKVERVLEVLSGVKTQAEVCREHRLQPHLFASWKQTFLERAPSLFAPGQQRPGAPARTAEPDPRVGRQAVELQALKKASSILASARRRSER